MSESEKDPRAKRVLKWFIVVLLLVAVVTAALGEFLLAGVMFLGIAFVIYLRETW